MFDWQTILTALIVLAALLYAARRGLSRLRSLRSSRGDAAALCASGCGKCGAAEKPARTTLVTLTRASAAPRNAPEQPAVRNLTQRR